MTDTFAGFHQFPDFETSMIRGEATIGGLGSFEVFYRAPGRGGNLTEGEWALAPGWYWWSCFPGCLPDGEPTGPFPTAEGAYLDAIKE